MARLVGCLVIQSEVSRRRTWWPRGPRAWATSSSRSSRCQQVLWIGRGQALKAVAYGEVLQKAMEEAAVQETRWLLDAKGVVF